VFGTDKTDSTSLKWSFIRKDNIMIRRLRQSALALGHAVEQQAKQVEKDLKMAKRVFYG
jgi:hypothetical protein